MLMILRLSTFIASVEMAQFKKQSWHQAEKGMDYEQKINITGVLIRMIRNRAINNNLLELIN